MSPTVLAEALVKNSRTSEAAIRPAPESCNLERKGYAKNTGIATEQAQRWDLVGPIRMTILG